MINLEKIKNLAQSFNLPIEDVLFVALNIFGANFECDFNRMRMGLHVTNEEIFSYAKQLGVRDFYFALPINAKSPFSVKNDRLMLNGRILGKAVNPSEDFCDSNYPRRGGTVLNFNPNSRTSCHGCKFCYTGYQVARDKTVITEEKDLSAFFQEWMCDNDLPDLSQLIQLAVVTGCYNSNNDLYDFLLMLKKVLTKYKFNGEIFYIGSQITDSEILKKLVDIQPFGYCASLECFEGRKALLRDKKNELSIEKAFELMAVAKSFGHRVNFSYVLGLETLQLVKKYFSLSKEYINSFPIVNTIQIHKYHSRNLLTPEAHKIEYFFKARKIIEEIFLDTDMKPRVWENYRSLWFLKFRNEVLRGIRTP